MLPGRGKDADEFAWVRNVKRMKPKAVYEAEDAGAGTDA
jgi:hypothetical protein